MIDIGSGSLETEISLEQAMEAINKGKRVTHDILNGKSIGKWKSHESVHGIEHGWDNRTDPLHRGTIYFKEYIIPIEIFDQENISLGLGGIEYNWIDDPDKRMIPGDGWILL